MKKILLVFATIWITVSGFAQKTADIGIWGGTSTYFGDMNENPSFQTFNPNFGAYFRYNFNARVGLRAMILTGTFDEEGLIEGTPWSFNKNVQDLSFQVEINFLKYILGVKKLPFTSYITLGLGFAYFPYSMLYEDIEAINAEHPMIPSGGYGDGDGIEESVVATTLPFGFGFKYSVGRRLGVGVEYQMRKILSDKLDDLDDPLAHFNDLGEEVHYTTGIHNMDWSGYLGVHITYMIYLGKKACPAYGSKKK
jgi:hypothetical protein